MKLILVLACLGLAQFVYSQNEGQDEIDIEIPVDNIGEVICYFGEMPSFPGGDTALEAFIYTRLTLPDTEPSEMGKIIVSFVIEVDGSVSDIKVVKGLSEPYNQAVIKVFSEMPKWNPSKIGDKTVRVRMHYPVLINY